MEMTKERLEAYRSNREEIKELDYILQNRWKDESLIKIATINDYRKGYPVPQAVPGFDQEEYERKQDRDMKRKEWLEQECREVEEFINEIEEGMARRIFRMYYIDGTERITQRKVAKRIHVERSTVSRKIDDYLKVSHNSQNAQL